MKIVMGADQYPEYINGAAHFTLRLAAGLSGRGHEVDLLLPAADGRAGQLDEGGLRIHRLTSLALPSRPPIRTCLPWTAGREIEAILRAAQPDIVHAQSHLILGRTLIAAAANAGVPVMATNHFMPENLVHHVPVLRRFPERTARLAWRDLERVFRGAGLISVPTRRAADLLASSTALLPATTISCGVDLDHYQARPVARSTNEPTILFVGRLEEEKHVDELLTAFARVPHRYGARLRIVGMGSLRPELEALADRLGLAARVRFAGAVSDADLVAAYRSADVFVMPGTAELQSLATLEAMAAGLPVVAADAMALPHLVGKDNGFLYPPGDVRVLSARLTALVGEPGLRRRLGAASRRKVQEHTMAATLTAYEQAYASLTARSPAVPQFSGTAGAAY